ncbi:MAG: hypothetical protein CVV45_10595 [Spirochaetae bacterium HGW-Spirochaetae-10]|nr:MAG: hypothetical protein CVV45_10595 [Spirochaetae bacterium HGW-Spirochaetae-10]
MPSFLRSLKDAPVTVLRDSVTRALVVTLTLGACAMVSGCSTLTERSGTHESVVTGRNGPELFAKLPETLTEKEALHQEARIVRTQLTGNPRHGRWAQVERGRAVIVGIDKGMMRLRLLSGVADTGDRILCCYGTIDDADTERPVRSNLGTGRRKEGEKRPKPSGSLRDSVLLD